MELKPLKRSKLTDALQKQSGMLKPNVLFITSFRATKDNSIQVEVCQNRNLASRKSTVLGMINASDKRFRGNHTLLFDWMILTPEDFLQVFPTVKQHVSLEELKAVAESYDPDAPKGKDALVFKAIHSIPYIYNVMEEKQVTPVIAVTEITHTQLINGEFFRGENREEKIENEIENGNSIMKTGAGDDADYIVDAETGDKIYRFTQTVVREEYPKEDWDRLIPNKTTLKQFNELKSKDKSEYKNPEDLLIGNDNI